MLLELDETDPKPTVHSLTTGEDGQLNAGRGNRGGFPHRGGYPSQRWTKRRKATISRKPRQGCRRKRVIRPGGRGARSFETRFCRICYHAGSPEFVYKSHTISECSKLSTADKTDLRAILGAGEVDEQQVWESRQEVYEVPGWDVIDEPCDVIKINDSKSYSCESSILSQIQLNTIMPIPSQRIDTHFYD